MRKSLLYILLAAGLVLSVFTGMTYPAAAQQQTLQVRLADGSLVDVQVTVPTDGTSLEDIPLPTVPTVTAPAPTLPTPTSPIPTPTVPSLPGGGGTGGGTGGGSGGGSTGGGGSTTGGGGTSTGGGGATNPGSPSNSSPAPGGGSTTTVPGVGKVPTIKGRGKAQRRSGGTKLNPRGPVDGKTLAGNPIRQPDGVPTPHNPTFFEALPGPAQITGVPNFVIDKFRVPPFLLPIYQAAGIQYGIRWEVLAAINEIETDYGRNLNVSSAGAVGWMQFLPSTWKTWGVDANNDGRRDPYNPVDAIFSAARYLKAAGGDKDIRRAIFAYNHAGWYVDSVMLRANLIAGVPADVIGSLTGLTEARFPVYARARYADDITEAEAKKKFKAGQNAARVVNSNSTRKGINIFARKGAPVVAVNDGVIKKISRDRHGYTVVLQDVYGNQYTYSSLASVSRLYPVPKSSQPHGKTTAHATPANQQGKLPKPTAPASAGRQVTGSESEGKAKSATTSKPAAKKRVAAAKPAAAPKVVTKQRLFAHPSRPGARRNGGLEQIFNSRATSAGYTTFRNYFSRALGLNSKNARLKRLRTGSHVIGGTILGRLGKTDKKLAPHVYFKVRPAGKGAPYIDPKPILDGWKLLEATAIYRASGRNALYSKSGDNFSIGEVMLLPKTLLEKRVLSDGRIDIYPGGRNDIRTGQIDRRVLVTLEYLAESGMNPTVSSLKSGHGFYTSSGNVSEHSSGNAVDIAAVNGVPITGHQEPGGLTEQVVRRLMMLQGTMQPHQIISLLDLGQNTLSLPDHYDHIHVGFQPLFGTNAKAGKQALAVLKPGQWNDLVKRLGEIQNPVVPTRPSKFALPVQRKSQPGQGATGTD